MGAPSRRTIPKPPPLAVVIYFAFDYVKYLPQPGDRLVEGRIIKVDVKDATRRVDGEDRPGDQSLLTIQIVNTNTFLTVPVPGDWREDKSRVVKFYYSGDPTKMVYLQENGLGLLLNILFLLILGLIMILGIVMIMMLRQSMANASHNEYEALMEKIK